VADCDLRNCRQAALPDLDCVLNRPTDDGLVTHFKRWSWGIGTSSRSTGRRAENIPGRKAPRHLYDAQLHGGSVVSADTLDALLLGDGPPVVTHSASGLVTQTVVKGTSTDSRPTRVRRPRQPLNQTPGRRRSIDFPVDRIAVSHGVPGRVPAVGSRLGTYSTTRKRCFCETQAVVHIPQRRNP
jgi:hypothetical protein